MNKRKLVAGFVGLCLAITGLAIAVSASAAGGSSVTIKESQSFKFVPNRYVQDGLRWNKDVYKVKSGGTITVVNNKNNEGPHTFTVVKKKDLPRTVAQMNNCKVCNQIGAVHGADPNSEAPPKFQYVENGTKGQDTPPDVNQPGDSGVTGSGQKNEQISFKVTAKKGTQLYFMCLIHPWMQAKVQVQ